MMTESPVVNSWIARAVEETHLRDGRASVVEALTARFGSLPPEILTTIQQQPSLEMLREWHREACVATTLEEFVAILRR